MNIFKRFSVALVTLFVAISASVCFLPGRTSSVSAATPPPAIPSLNVIQYNTAVVFEWTVGARGTELALSTQTTYNLMGVSTYRDISFCNSNKDKGFLAMYVSGKSYNATTRVYSDAKDLSGHGGTYSHLRDCKYQVVDSLAA